MKKDRDPPEGRMWRKAMVEQILDYWEQMVVPISERLSRLEFYLKTLEEFIDNQEASEVRDLIQRTEKLTDEQRSKFWAWSDPAHWDQIFRSRLRSSFLVVLVSEMEIYLNEICRDVAEINRSTIKVSDLRGTMLERSQKFLEGKFTGPDPEILDFVSSLYHVRNVFVHNAGRINDYRHSHKLSGFVETEHGLSNQNGSVEIDKEFCYKSVDMAKRLLQPLRDKLIALCQNTGTFEPD